MVGGSGKQEVATDDSYLMDADLPVCKAGITIASFPPQRKVVQKVKSVAKEHRRRVRGEV